MASVQHYADCADLLMGELLARRGQYQKVEHERHNAALIIQKVFRAYQVRVMIKTWNNAATVIQKWVRGWLVRWYLPELLREYLEVIRMRAYNRAATKIQAVWRSYWVWKNINIKELIAKRREIQELNETTKNMLKNAFEELREMQEKADFLRKKELTIRVLEQMHHLIRNGLREGVFSVHGSTKFSDIEKLIIYLSKRKRLMHKKNQSRNNVAENFLDDESILCTFLQPKM